MSKSRSSSALRAYQRRTKQADSLIAGAYLAGTNTRRVRRALSAVFGGAISKDTVSRVWRKVKGDWDAWNARSLAEEPIIRLILDGTVVRVRLDRMLGNSAARPRLRTIRSAGFAQAPVWSAGDHRRDLPRERRHRCPLPLRPRERSRQKQALGTSDYLNATAPPVRGSWISNWRWASVG
jgi:hypothetical protein